MSAAGLRQGAPLRFLLAVTIAWTMGRGAILFGWQPPTTVTAVIGTAHAAPGPVAKPMGAAFALRQPAPRAAAAGRGISPLLRPATMDLSLRQPPTAIAPDQAGAAPLLLLAAYDPADGPLYARPGGMAEAAGLLHPGDHRPRLSGSAWAFVRGGGRATALSPGGQIGGGQMGARVLARLDEAGRISAAGRISTTVGGVRQSEAAAGLDWKPLATLPVHVMLDRRFAIDKGGRNAWTVGLAGGVYAVPIAPGWRLDGYAEAGVVGARRRDLYADGGARVTRSLEFGGRRSLSLGGGAWGAAQPGAARLDVGPSAVLRLPVAGRALAVALDWRERIAGGARPGSGLALTIATDF